VELGDPTIALRNSEYCPVTHGIVRKIEQSCSPPRKSRRTFAPPVFITLQKVGCSRKPPVGRSKSDQLPINAVVSIGRRNTQVEPTVAPIPVGLLLSALLLVIVPIFPVIFVPIAPVGALPASRIIQLMLPTDCRRMSLKRRSPATRERVLSGNPFCQTLTYRFRRRQVNGVSS
jgi:hypothetical protein